MPNPSHPAIPTRQLLELPTLREVEDVLSKVAANGAHPASQSARALLPDVRQALAGHTVGDTHAIAQLCTTTLDAVMGRSITDDDGNFLIEATDAERDDERGGIQVIAEVNALRSYLAAVVEAGTKAHPLGDLVIAYRSALDLIGSLHASMDELGFYDSPEHDTQVDGGDTVDALTQLSERITHVLTHGVASLAEATHTHAAVASPSAPLATQGFEVERTWVLSSRHIPADLYAHLQSEAAAPTGTDYAAFSATAASPYMVLVDVRDNDDGSGAETPHESLTHILVMARHHGFTHVRFDRDALLVDCLPSMDAGEPPFGKNIASGAMPGMRG